MGHGWMDRNGWIGQRRGHLGEVGFVLGLGLGMGTGLEFVWFSVWFGRVAARCCLYSRHLVRVYPTPVHPQNSGSRVNSACQKPQDIASRVEKNRASFFESHLNFPARHRLPASICSQTIPTPVRSIRHEQQVKCEVK